MTSKRWSKNTRRLVTLSLSLLSLAITVPATAQITIRHTATTGQLSVERHNEAQFRKGFGMRVETDATALDDKSLEQHIAGLQLATRSGNLIQSFTYTKAHNLIVGTSLPETSVTLNVVKQTATGREVAFSVRNAQGRLVAVKPDDIGVMTLNGRHVGHVMTRFSEAKHLHAYFTLLVDRSGSMRSVIGQVRRAARAFLKSLPKNAKCRLISFNRRYREHSDGFVSCRSLARHVGRLRAKGGTNLQGPLIAAYEGLKGVSEDVKAVLVITDGVGDIDKDEVLAKKSAPTHVNFIGAYKKERLKGIADTFIFGKRNFRSVLKRYFDQANDAISRQYVLAIDEPAGAATQ